MICLRKLLLTIGITSLLWLAACQRVETPPSYQPPADAPPVVKTAPRVPSATPSSGANVNANANSTPVQPIAANNASVITETNDAVIILTNDLAGNRIETKVFKAHPWVNKIIVITAPNHEQRARLYGNRGETRDLPPELLPKALDLNADQLAAALGLGPAGAVSGPTRTVKSNPPAHPGAPKQTAPPASKKAPARS